MSDFSFFESFKDQYTNTIGNNLPSVRNLLTAADNAAIDGNGSRLQTALERGNTLDAIQAGAQITAIVIVGVLFSVAGTTEKLPFKGLDFLMYQLRNPESGLSVKV